MAIRAIGVPLVAAALIGGLALPRPAAAGGKRVYNKVYGYYQVVDTVAVKVHGGHGRHRYRHPRHYVPYRGRRVVVRTVEVIRPTVVYRTAAVPPPPAAAEPYCREFVDTVTIDGRPVEAYGTACRQQDGSWRIVAQE